MISWDHTRHIIRTPAFYTFPYFQEESLRVRNRVVDEMKKWSWCNAVELRDACYTILLYELFKSAQISAEHVKVIFDLRNYSLLNANDWRDADGRMTWFIAEGQGHLFPKKEASACAFDADQELFFPARFAVRILAAVRKGVKDVKAWRQNGDLEVVYFNLAPGVIPVRELCQPKV